MCAYDHREILCVGMCVMLNGFLYNWGKIKRVRTSCTRINAVQFLRMKSFECLNLIKVWLYGHLFQISLGQNIVFFHKKQWLGLSSLFLNRILIWSTFQVAVIFRFYRLTEFRGMHKVLGWIYRLGDSSQDFKECCLYGDFGSIRHPWNQANDQS